MSPKEKYDERKRLRAERLLREEQRAKDARDRDDERFGQTDVSFHLTFGHLRAARQALGDHNG